MEDVALHCLRICGEHKPATQPDVDKGIDRTMKYKPYQRCVGPRAGWGLVGEVCYICRICSCLLTDKSGFTFYIHTRAILHLDVDVEVDYIRKGRNQNTNCRIKL